MLLLLVGTSWVVGRPQLNAILDVLQRASPVPPLDLLDLVLDVEDLVLVHNETRERLQKVLVVLEQLTFVRQLDLEIRTHFY